MPRKGANLGANSASDIFVSFSVFLYANGGNEGKSTGSKSRRECFRLSQDDEVR